MEFFPEHCDLPHASPQDKLSMILQDLMGVLTNPITYRRTPSHTSPQSVSGTLRTPGRQRPKTKASTKRTNRSVLPTTTRRQLLPNHRHHNTQQPTWVTNCLIDRYPMAAVDSGATHNFFPENYISSARAWCVKPQHLSLPSAGCFVSSILLFISVDCCGSGGFFGMEYLFL
jgi:hypothetical protein